MKLLLGIDGGQTSTKAVVMDDGGRLLGAGNGGPADHINEPGGVDRVRASLSEAIAGAREAAGAAGKPIACAYLGMTGGSREMEEVCRPVVDAERMVLGHDSLIALYSVTLGKPGVVVIGGTGSVGFGRTADGRTARTGGWGYVFGDEGSGYWIAVRALNACARAADGLAPQTDILGLLLRRLNVATLLDIHRLIYSGALSRPDIAALASSVSEAARGRDRAAQQILQAAGEELGRLAIGVLKSLHLQNEHVTVGAVGGVFRAGAWVLDPFTRVVKAEAPYAAVAEPVIPAAVGAALLALEEVGGSVDGRVTKNVHATLGILGELKR